MTDRPIKPNSNTIILEASDQPLIPIIAGLTDITYKGLVWTLEYIERDLEGDITLWAYRNKTTDQALIIFND